MKPNSTIAAVEEVLLQGKTLLAEVDPELYAVRAGEPFGASIGQHYRHVLDHFLCLLEGMNSDVIDYDHRSRNRQLETDIEEARRLTDELIEVFKSFAPHTWNWACSVAYTVGYGVEGPSIIPSTLGRELAFCVSHSVHHYAIIRLLCAHLRVQVPAEFGVAPSTLKYRLAQLAN
ncbi:MAG: DinB family protein [Acidobacteriales bacterium]|nr:DinB family protein [Terriglobales bacterium]